MMHWQNSQPSAATADLISGKGHVLTMTSRQYDPQGKLPEMEKIMGQLFDLMKSITQELCLQGPSPAITTTPLPPSTVMEYHNPNHEAHDLYQRSVLNSHCCCFFIFCLVYERILLKFSLAAACILNNLPEIYNNQFLLDKFSIGRVGL